MLKELREKLSGLYPKGCEKELEEAESILRFDQFDSKIALSLGEHIVEKAQKYGKDVAIQITREADDAIIFQYVGNHATARNLSFAKGKADAVRKTGHCGLWIMAMEQNYGGYDEFFEDHYGCYPVGGAFPIRVGEELVAILGLSGLDNGDDHRLIVQSLCEFLDCEVPEFSGKLI